MNWYKKWWKPKSIVIMVVMLLSVASSGAAEMTQVVTLEQASFNLNLQDEISVNVYYDTIPSGSKTFAPNLWIHYASSQFEYLGYENFNLYGAAFLGNPSDGADDINLDGNAGTDKKIAIGYFDLQGAWPNVSGKILLVTLKFRAIGAGNIPINVTRNDGGGSSGFIGNGSTVIIAEAQDTTPPVVNFVKANDTQTSLSIEPGVNSITLTTEITDAGTGDSNIAAAEYFINPIGTPTTGTGTGMTPVDTLDSSTESFTSTIDTSSWTNGQTHIIKVRGQDAAGMWSSFGSVTINVKYDVDSAVSTFTVDATTGKVANNSDFYTFVVTAKKSDGTPVPQKSVSLSVDGDATGTTIVPALATTDGVGAATFTMKSSKVGNFTVKATAGGVLLNASHSVNFTVGPPAKIVLSAKDNKIQIVTDGSDSTVIQGTVQDIQGNIVTTYSSNTGNPDIIFTVTSGSTLADFGGSTSKTVLRGNVVNGVAEVTLNSKDVDSEGNVVIAVTATGLSSPNNLTITAANERLDSISIAFKAGSTATPKVGDSTSFQATGNYVNPDGSNAGSKDITALVAWNSSDTLKAAFKGTNDGILTAENIGSTNITASFDGKTSTAIVVTVQAGDPVNINTFGLPTILNYDETFDLGAAVSGGSGAGFTYSVTDQPDTGAGIVSATGVVSIDGTKAFAGHYTITVTDAKNKQENTYSFEVPAVLSPNSGTFKEKDGAVTFAIKGVKDSVAFTTSFLNASNVAIGSVGSFSANPVVDTDGVANNMVTFQYTPPNGVAENINENKEFKAAFTAQSGELVGQTIKSSGMFTIIALIDYSATVKDSATSAVLEGVEVTAVSLNNAKDITITSGVFTFSDIEVSDADYTFSFAKDNYAPKTITLSIAEMKTGADVLMTALDSDGIISGTITLDGVAGAATVKVKDDSGNFFTDSSNNVLEVVSNAGTGAFEMPIPAANSSSTTFTTVAATSGYVEGSVTVNNPDPGGTSINATIGTLNLKPATLITVKGELINSGVDLKVSVNAAAGSTVFDTTPNENEVELTVTNAETNAVFSLTPVFDAANNAWTKTIPNYDGSVIKIDVKADVSEDSDVNSGYFSQMTWYYVEGQQVPKVAMFDDPNTNGGGVATDDNSVKVQLPAGQLNADFKKARFIIGPAVPLTAGFTNVVGPVFTEIVLQDENGDLISNNDLEYVEITLQVEPGTSLDDFTKGERFIVRAANSADLKKEVAITTLPTDKILKVENNSVTFSTESLSAFGISEVPINTPSIALNPTSGQAGTTVTITGSNFASAFSAATAVMFDGAAVTKTIVNATTINFTVPAVQTVGNKTVMVTNSGESATAFFNVPVIAPSIALNPASTLVDTTPSVTITGTNFASGFTSATVVTFAGTAVAKTGVTATTITFVVPAGQAAGVKTVQVTNSGESATASFSITSNTTPDPGPGPGPGPSPDPTPQPKADFTYSPESPEVGGVITFTDQSTGTDSFTIDAWEWDFGDDSDTTDAQNPTHTYSETGSYTVTLRVTSTDNQEIATQKTITVVGVRKPEASFSVSPASGTEPLSVSFTDTSTGIGITGWSWTFGDGGSSNQQNPTHTYSEGIYTVTLVVTNEAGDSTAKKTVLVNAVTPPDVIISANFSYAKDELKVTFTDQSSISAGSIASWNWTFGNAGTSTSQNPVFTFPATGTYTVTLAVADQDGNSASASKNITVTKNIVTPIVTAGFAPDRTSGDAPLEVNFLDTSTAENDQIEAWNWNFGDGGTSAEPSPTHTYTQAGTFSAKLIVIGASGLTSSKTMQITAFEGPCEDCPEPPTPGPGAPVDGSRVDTMTPDLEVTPPAGTSSVQWQVATDPNFTNIVWDETGSGNTLNINELLLDPDTTYYWRSRSIDESGKVSEWSDAYSFITPAVDSDDQDGSGVPDDQDLDDPEVVFPDVTQGVLTKFFNSVIGNISFAIEGIENVDEIVSAMAYGNDGVTPPANTKFNWGFVDFKAKVKKDGEATFKLHFSEKLSDDVIKWYKTNYGNELTDYSDYVTISPSRMSATIVIKDGGFGDADGVANGIIVGPIGPGTVAEDNNGGGGGDGDSSGNTCFIQSLAGVSSSFMIGIALLSGVLAFALGRKQQ